MRKLSFLLILILWTHQSSGVIDDSFALAQKVVRLLSIVSNIRESGRHVMTLADQIKNPTSEDVRKLLHMTNEIHKDLNRTAHTGRLAGIATFVNELPFGQQIQLREKLSNISLLMGHHKNLYETLRWAIDRIFTIDDWKLYSRDQIDGKEIADIRALNLVDDLAIYGNSSYLSICGNGQTIKYYVVEYFKYLMAAEARAVTLSAYALLMEDPSTHVWKQRLPKIKREYESNFLEGVTKLRRILDIAPGNMRSCDGNNGTWIRDENYYEIEKLDQAVIFDYTINPFKKRTCNDFLDASYQKSYFNAYTSCKGELADCVYLGKAEACLAFQNTTKRYEWVKGTAGNYGMNFDHCDGEKIQRSWSYKLGHSSCICNCFEEGNFVSTELIQSDVGNNMIVTGARLIRRDRVLYIQPKQGKLLPNGAIDPHSESWVELLPGGKVEILEKNNKAFFLDDVMVPLGATVTGIGFVPVVVNGVQGFKIRVQATQFDYTNGSVCSVIECSSTHQIDHNESSPLNYDIKNSIYSNITHVPDSTNGSYAKLYRSSLPHDVGQSVVPLFDGVSVETKLPSPLGGIGIFHKGVEGFAGFISLRVHALQYESYVTNFIENLKRGTLSFMS